MHVIGPELGLTQPGMTICCGDSHTSTHGAFGAIAFGIGTSQVRDVLATQTLAMGKLKVRRIEVERQAAPRRLRQGRRSCTSSTSSACRAASATPTSSRATCSTRFSMEERMTVCNMSIEGGARCGYVNPDETTYAYLRGREYAPEGRGVGRAVAYWDCVRSRRRRAATTTSCSSRAEDIEPVVTWGITPGAVDAGRRRRCPTRDAFPADERGADRRGVPLHGLRARQHDRAARRSTSRSSARAPTAASRTSRRSSST